MEHNTTFEAGDTVIDLEKVMAFEDVDTSNGTGDQALTVYLANGATVAVKGEEKVEEFVHAIDELLVAEEE
jgi:hypothetical protein